MSSRCCTCVCACVCVSLRRDVSAAIPMPGFLESMSPAVAALRNSPVPLPLPMMGPDTKDVLRALSAVLPSPIKRDEAGQISEAALALDQIKSVFGEVSYRTRSLSLAYDNAYLDSRTK